jgi:hypothetical protein
VGTPAIVAQQEEDIKQQLEQLKQEYQKKIGIWSNGSPV